VNVDAIIMIILITALYAVGGKIAFYFKNREIALLREQFEKEIKTAHSAHESARATLSDDLVKQLRRQEEVLQTRMTEKDQQYQSLLADYEALKSWKEEMGLKMAEFKGASQGNPHMLIFKLLEHNQKLTRAMTAKWAQVEDHLKTNLSQTLDDVKRLFAEAEALHREGLEIISIYESRMPDDLKRKVHEEFLRLPAASKVPALPES